MHALQRQSHLLEASAKLLSAAESAGKIQCLASCQGQVNGSQALKATSENREFKTRAGGLRWTGPIPWVGQLPVVEEDLQPSCGAVYGIPWVVVYQDSSANLPA